jgi:hypothetical protein
MISEPHKTKTIRNINFLGYLDRINALEKADFNTNKLLICLSFSLINLEISISKFLT